MASVADKRFLGNAKSFDVGNGVRRSGWKIVCSGCGSSHFVSISGQRPLPPEIILKKLRQAGWGIAHNPNDDLCGPCQKLTRKESKAPIKTIVTNGKDHPAAAQQPPPVQLRATYDTVFAFALGLPAEQKRELIEALRRELPQQPQAQLQQQPQRDKVPRKPKNRPTIIENDPEYEQWLKGE